MRGTFAWCSVVVACSGPTLSSSPPVVVDITAPPSSASSPAARDAGILHDADRDLSGIWWEETGEPGSCSAILIVKQHGLAFELDWRDCTKESPFPIERLHFDGTKLSFRVVPSEYESVDYELELVGGTSFRGMKRVYHESVRYNANVVWHRGRPPPLQLR